MPADATGRYEYYQLEGEGRQVRLRKWSLNKFFAIVTALSELGEKLIEKLARVVARPDGTETWVFAGKPKEILDAILTFGTEGLSKIKLVVKESIEEPDVGVDQIGEWSLEDSLGIFQRILEFNLTPNLVKKLVGLRDILVQKLRVPGAPRPTE